MSMGITNPALAGYAAAQQALGAKKPAAGQPVAPKADLPGGEGKLSAQAAEYLAKMRKERPDGDIMVADKKEDFQSLAAQGTKEYSVILSVSELEKMAADADYAAEVNRSIDVALDMADKITKSEEFQSELAKSGATLKNIAVTVGEDGTTTLLATLEKISEQQLERREKLQEKKAAEKAADEAKAEKAANNPYQQEQPRKILRQTIEAATPEDLLEKLQNLTWDDAEEADARPGALLDKEA